MQISICKECQLKPVTRTKTEAAFWCQHTGDLIVESIETGNRMGWNAVTRTEVPRILRNAQLSALVCNIAEQKLKAERLTRKEN